MAALQTGSLVTRRDEAAKRAHPLGSKVTIVGIHPDRLSEVRCQKGARTSYSSEKRMWEESHDRHPQNDIFTCQILCKIARFCVGRTIQCLARGLAVGERQK